MSGLDSNKATTTMKVVEVSITQEQLLEKLTQHRVNSWGVSEDEAEDEAEIEMRELIRLANHFPTWSILEKRGRNFRVRRLGEGKHPSNLTKEQPEEI